MASASYICAENSPALVYADIAQLLDNAAKEVGEKAAYIFRMSEGGSGGKELSRTVITFNQLSERSLTLAAGFLQIGLQPGDTVAMAANNCPEWLDVEYACLRIKLLLIRLPINLIDEQRLIRMLAKYSCRVLIVDCQVAEKLRSFVERFFQASLPDYVKERIPALNNVFLLDHDNASRYNLPKAAKTISQLAATSAGDECKVREIQQTIDPEEMAVCYPTSGTTGEPQYVAHNHFAVINSILNLCRLLDNKTGQNVYFSDRFFSWIAGRVHLPVVSRFTLAYLDNSMTMADDVTSAIDLVLRVFQEDNVTAAMLMSYLMVGLMKAKITKSKIGSSVETVFTGGDRLAGDVLDYASTLFPKVFILYGSTECFTIGKVLIESDKSCNKGKTNPFKCFPHFEIKIAADDGKVLPRGQIGHILVRSICGMRGYYMDPETTQAVISEKGWIRTTDMGTLNKEGILDIVSRTKDVISKGAIKIHPKVIEDILKEHPKVDEVCVVGVPDPRFFQEICACIVTKRDAELTESDLKHYLTSSMLKDIFLPKYYVFVGAFPKNQTGKIVKQTLINQAMLELGLESN